MVLELVRDDGAAIYLNGKEIARDNLEILANAKKFAAAPVSRGGESKAHYFTVNPSLLVEGVNTLAVEVHQSDLTSSDLSFDLQLSTNVSAPLAKVLLAQDADQTPIASLKEKGVVVFNVDARRDWQDTRLSVTKGETVVFSAEGTYSFRARGTTDANGFRDNPNAKPASGKWPVNELPGLALIGRIGKNGKPF